MAIYVNPQDAVKLGIMYQQGATREEMGRKIRAAAKRYEATHPQEKPRASEGRLANSLVCAPSVRYSK